MNSITQFFICLLLFSSLVGCQSKQPTLPYSSAKTQENFQEQKMIDSTALLTKKMMQASIFSGVQDIPIIVIGKITNATGDDELSTDNIENVIKDVVAKSRKAKILPCGTFEFDYTTHAVIGYVENQNNSQTLGENIDYTIRLQLLNYYGELIEQWSAQAETF